MSGSFNQIIGRDINGTIATFDSAWSKTPAYTIGQEIQDDDGNIYAYVKTAENVSISVSAVVILLTAGAEAITTTLAADNGIKCGVALAACTAASGTTQYGWVIVYTGVQQVTSMNVGADCEDHLSLQTSSVAGVVDDATGQVHIAGLGIGTTQISAAGANTTAVLNRPYVEIGWA